MAKKAQNTPAVSAELPKGYVPTLKKVYREEIVDKLVKQFSYTTVMQVPRLVKITINEGVGDGTQDKKLVEESEQDRRSEGGSHHFQERRFQLQAP